MFSRFTHIGACECFITFYGHIVFSCTCIQFVDPFISWWTLVLFVLGTIMNSAAMNICVSVFVRHTFSIPLGIYLGVAMLEHAEILCLAFWSTSSLFSKVVAPFCIPTPTAYEGSTYPTFLPTFDIICLLYFISVGVKWTLVSFTSVTATTSCSTVHLPSGFLLPPLFPPAVASELSKAQSE